MSGKNKLLPAVRRAAEVLAHADGDREYYEMYVTAWFVNAAIPGYSAEEGFVCSCSSGSGAEEQEERAAVQLLLNRAAQQADGTEIDPDMPVMVLSFQWYGNNEPVDGTVFIRLTPGEARTLYKQLNQAD